MADDIARTAPFGDLLRDRPDLAGIVSELDAFASSIRPPVGLEERIAALAVSGPTPRLRLMPPRGPAVADLGSAPAPASSRSSVLVRVAGLAAALVFGALGLGVVTGQLPTGLLAGGAGASVPPGTPIDWDNGAVQLTADGLTIMAGDTAFVTPQDPASLRGYSGSPTYRELQGTWFQDDIEMRLNVYLEADAERWWVDQIWTYGGFPDPGGHSWLEYHAPPIGAPLGQAWEGDLDLATDVGEIPGRLVGRNVRMTAWVPGSVAGVHAGCSLPGGGMAGHDALAPGEPLRGSGILEMTPGQARDLLEARGMCYAFESRYDLVDENGKTIGADGDTWCTPPKGVIESVKYGGWGQIRVIVPERPNAPVPSPRPTQPPVGYGCPWPPAAVETVATPLFSPG